MIARGKPESGALPRVWLEINKSALARNLNTIKGYVSPLKVMAVLKADAYGLGVEGVAVILVDAGADCIGVAEVEKAVLIKPLGVPICILGGLVDEDIAVVVNEGLIAPITDLRVANLLSKEAVHRNRKVKCQFKIDTGMGRLGIPIAEARDVLNEVLSLPGLDFTGIYSHFPVAYGDTEFSARQVEQFCNLPAELERKNFNFSYVHMANSDGIHNVSQALKPPFTMVRTGINLYGAYDAEGERKFPVEPVIELKSRLVAVRTLPKGSTIGYGAEYVTDREMRVGTVSIGYADGVPFGISGHGRVVIGGKSCPVIGRVSMDFITVSLEQAADAQVGAEVVCLNKELSVAEWARYKGTISYDIICSFGTRVARCYV